MSTRTAPKGTPFSTVLVANRGEIACRILRTARALGYRTTAVFSDADAHAPHVALADRAVRIGPASSAESYLNVERILEAAVRTGSDAIHPGYGFLSERVELADACERAGVTFVGPPSSAMAAVANKREAKALMRAAGVPVVPGTEGPASDEVLKRVAFELGPPVMIKASWGGGGRGMRLVQDLLGLDEALERARAEAERAFGDGELLLEKALTGARHVEIQIVADHHGRCVHLGERDCSVQRRHQKIVEECPSPAVGLELREKMGTAAVRAAASIGYVGAGTVEFLLAPTGEFYFLEMNTRLQVEHAVTEMVTGLDLVELQLEVAAGLPLSFEQDDVAFRGHAIEARVYAEDPWAGFLPASGQVLTWRPASEAHVRVDGGIREGQKISTDYDAMVAKIIAWAPTRASAARRLLRSLEATRLHGVSTNLELVHAVIDHPRFRAGEATTAFIEGELGPSLASRPPIDRRAEALAAALLALGDDGAPSWRSTGPAEVPLVLTCRGARRPVRVRFEGLGATLAFGEEVRFIELEPHLGRVGDGEVAFTFEGILDRASVTRDGARLFVQLGARVELFERVSLSQTATLAAVRADRVTAPMTGLLVEVRTEPGARVRSGETLAVLEAMKMQMPLLAPREGEILEVHARAGEQVEARAPIVTLVPEG